jgi:hypothetical protein
MEATSLEQIAYNLEVSKDQVRQMNESVQQVRAGGGGRGRNERWNRVGKGGACPVRATP